MGASLTTPAAGIRVITGDRTRASVKASSTKAKQSRPKPSPFFRVSRACTAPLTGKRSASPNSFSSLPTRSLSAWDDRLSSPVENYGFPISGPPPKFSTFDTIHSPTLDISIPFNEPVMPTNESLAAALAQMGFVDQTPSVSWIDAYSRNSRNSGCFPEAGDNPMPTPTQVITHEQLDAALRQALDVELCNGKDRCNTACVSKEPQSGPPLSWIIYEFLHLVPDNSVMRLVTEEPFLKERFYAALCCPHTSGQRALAQVACILSSFFPVDLSVEFLLNQPTLLSRCILPHCDNVMVFAAISSLLVNVRYFVMPPEPGDFPEFPNIVAKATLHLLGGIQPCSSPTLFSNAVEILDLCVQCIPPQESSPYSQANCPCAYNKCCWHKIKVETPMRFMAPTMLSALHSSQTFLGQLITLATQKQYCATILPVINNILTLTPVRHVLAASLLSMILADYSKFQALIKCNRQSHSFQLHTGCMTLKLIRIVATDDEESLRRISSLVDTLFESWDSVCISHGILVKIARCIFKRQLTPLRTLLQNHKFTHDILFEVGMKPCYCQEDTHKMQRAVEL